MMKIVSVIAMGLAPSVVAVRSSHLQPSRSRNRSHAVGSKNELNEFFLRDPEKPKGNKTFLQKLSSFFRSKPRTRTRKSAIRTRTRTYAPAQDSVANGKDAEIASPSRDAPAPPTIGSQTWREMRRRSLQSDLNEAMEAFNEAQRLSFRLWAKRRKAMKWNAMMRKFRKEKNQIKWRAMTRKLRKEIVKNKMPTILENV